MVNILPLAEVSAQTVQDITVLQQQLSLDNNAPTVTEENLREIVANPYSILMTAQDEGRIVGTALLFILPKPTKRIAHVDDVVVSEEYRGQGLGEKIMRALIDSARERNVSAIELTSRPARVAAQSLYQKIGFVKRDTDVFKLKL